MEVAAKLTGAQISPQKVRLVADQIRGKSAEDALDVLNFSKKKAAAIVLKVLNSAIANAEHNEGADVDELDLPSLSPSQFWEGGKCVGDDGVAAEGDVGGVG